MILVNVFLDLQIWVKLYYTEDFEETQAKPLTTEDEGGIHILFK
jgi:hypothetical protein